MVPTNQREIVYAGIAIAVISVAYLAVLIRFETVPAARGLFGHLLGILGFILMLMTETLYSLRKRSRRARWGPMASWLQFHIFTGLVGPYMVLLHSAWKFQGLAGILMLLTIITVASGILGRYIYTSVPRTADGIVLEASTLEAQIRSIEAELEREAASPPAVPELTRMISSQMVSPGTNDWELIFGRTLEDLRYRWQSRRSRKRYPPEMLPKVEQWEQLHQRWRQLQRQVASLAIARRLLALWHAIHIPIGLALFAVAFLHILGAVYFATLLR